MSIGYERFEPGLLTEKLAQQLIFKHVLTVTLPLCSRTQRENAADWGLIPEGKVLSFSFAISPYVFHADYTLSRGFLTNDYVSFGSRLIHVQVGGSSVEGYTAMSS